MHMTMEPHIIRIIAVKLLLVPVFVIFLPFLPFVSFTLLLIPTCLVG